MTITAQSCDTAIICLHRNEVQRIMSTAFQRWYREHDNLRRAAEARLTVKRNATKRCLRHWRALAQAQRAHREWRLERLRLASEQRQRRLLVAWQVVAGLLAEHNRLVKSRWVVGREGCVDR